MVNVYESSSDNTLDNSEKILNKNDLNDAEDEDKVLMYNFDKKFPKTPRNSIDINYVGLSDKNIANKKLNISKQLFEIKQINSNVPEDQQTGSVTIDRFCVQSVEDAAMVMRELNNRPVTIHNVVIHDDAARFKSKGKRNACTFCLFTGIILLLIFITSVYLRSRMKHDLGKNSDIYLPVNIGTYEFINRNYLDPIDPVNTTKLESPIDSVIVQQTSSDLCFNKTDCIEIVKQFHHHNDLYGSGRFNFFIGGDGRVYEGMGYHFRPHHEHIHFHRHNHTNIRNPIEIGLIGRFDNVTKKQPTVEQYNTLKAFLNDGIRKKKIDSHFTIIPSKCIDRDGSPVFEFDKEIRTWNHYFRKHRVHRDYCRDELKIETSLE